MKIISTYGAIIAVSVLIGLSLTFLLSKSKVQSENSVIVDCWHNTDDTPVYIDNKLVPLAENTSYCLVVPNDSFDF